MLKAHFTKWFVGVLLVIGSITTSRAATISLIPSNQNVVLGDQVTLQLLMDFTDDPTLAGGLDIFFDSSRLSFVSFAFDPLLGDDPAFRRQPDVLLNELNGLAFGNFAGLSGPSPVGILTFNTLLSDPTSTSFTMTDNDSPAGPFFSATTSLQQIVTYQGAAVTIVPLPATVWLFSAGLIGFVGLIKKRR